jgi:type II secretory pathway pseudopilin PulG
VIMGVLATLAAYGVRKYVLEAKRGEAVGMLTQIRSAEEAYRDEKFVYLGLDDFKLWTPTSDPGGTRNGWDSGVEDDMRKGFRELGVVPDGAVEYSYSVVAGVVGAPLPALALTIDPNIPAATGPFYIAMAKGDLNNDGSYTYALAYSGSNNVTFDDKY